MKVTAVKTGIYRQSADLGDFIWSAAGEKLRERTIVAVTSKIVSIAEGRILAKNATDKKNLIRKEADHFLCETKFGVCLTIKEGLVLPSAGIDESNSESGDYILYPKNPYASAEEIWTTLKKKSGISELGVIITDSHTTPLRKGVLGIALSHYGFVATNSFIGHDDLFGRKLRMTQVNVLDALAVSAVLVMGEASERQPIALIEHDEVKFTQTTSVDEIRIPLEEDLYGPLLTALKV